MKHLNRGRRRTGVAIAGAIVLAAGLLSSTSASASHGLETLSGSNFEIDTDANLIRDDASPSIDWASITETRKQDTPSGRTDESFGQGTKEDTASPIVVNGSIPPNKSDLKYFGVYQEGSGSDGFLNLYWSRVQEPVGTTNMDFEFNHNQCTPGLTPVDPDCSANGITPVRADGDLLITYDLAQGGTHAVISLRTWSDSAGAWGAADALSGTTAAGSINTSPISVTNSDGLGAHSARTFGEAQIALSAIFGSGCESFGSAYLKSRASDSFSAALKDFVPPAAVNITNCVQTAITTAQSFVPNDSATVTAPAGKGDLVGNVVFKLYDNATCSGTALYDSGNVSIAGGTGTGLSRTVSSANTTAYTTNKTFSWLVTYTSTNTGHLGVTSVCNDEKSSITIDNNFIA